MIKWSGLMQLFEWLVFKWSVQRMSIAMVPNVQNRNNKLLGCQTAFGFPSSIFEPPLYFDCLSS